MSIAEHRREVNDYFAILHYYSGKKLTAQDGAGQNAGRGCLTRTPLGRSHVLRHLVRLEGSNAVRQGGEILANIIGILEGKHILFGQLCPGEHFLGHIG